VSRRLGRTGDLVVGLFALAAIAAPSAEAALPAGYTANPVENASGSTSDRFGARMVNAGDVNADGKDDLLVGMPESPGGLPGVSGRVVFLDGGTGQAIRTIPSPSSDWLISHEGATTAFGAQVATIGDLTGDGAPEHAVSAPGSDINASAVDMGIVYVLDGRTHEISKRIQLAPDDRPGSPSGFGKALSATGGDLDGGGETDIVVGAPDYAEDALSDTNPDACPFGGPATCPGLGRVYVYRGEDVSGSPTTPLVNPLYPIKYFDAAAAAQQPRLGAALAPIGDVGSCVVSQPPGPSNSSCLTATQAFAPGNVPDGYPDYLVSAPGLPSGGVSGAGRAYIVDGRHGLAISDIGSPDPEAGLRHPRVRPSSRRRRRDGAAGRVRRRNRPGARLPVQRRPDGGGRDRPDRRSGGGDEHGFRRFRGAR
jgi:hypothetical protein